MDRLAIIDSESRRFAEVLAAADPDLRCPTCPDWTAVDLLWHLTNVHFFWAGILAGRVLSEAGLPAVEKAKPERPAAVADLLELRAQGTQALLEQLSTRDDAERLWSWWDPDQTVGFTRRMQTYEATMHRVDAELTAGLPVSAIAADVAAGCVDQAVDVMWGWMPAGASYQAECVVRFEAGDTGEVWLVEIGSWSRPGQNGGAAGTGPRAVRAGASSEPTATVNAPVEDLALWAWTRGGLVRRSGDASSLAALDALLAEGMP